MTSSLINNIVTPDSTAQAVTHEDLARAVNQLVLRQTMLFATVGERTTVLASVLAIHGLAPPAGAISHISTLSRYDRYDGTNWLPFMLAADFSGLANPWTPWTPTLTNLTLGNGTVVAKHRTIGKTLDYRFKFTLGSTSAVGTLPRFSLPFAAHADYAVLTDKVGSGVVLDAGINGYEISLRFATNNSTVEFVTIGTNGLHGAVSATNPFTFATGDVLAASGRLELA